MSFQLSKEEFHRYSRHIILPQFGVEGQVKLKESNVLVVGAGGLGVPILLYLAAAGVGQIGIVDFDRIEYSNLQRQVLYRSDQVGLGKAISARDFITKQNPEIKIEVFDEWINSSNAMQIAEGYDLIVDGTDNFPTRYLLNDLAILKNIPYIYGSIYRFEGQVSVFNYENGPNYRDLYPDPPAPEIVPNCSEGGVLGVLPGIVGSIQALEAIKVLTGIGEVLSGKLLTIDTLTNSYRSFKFKKKQDSSDIKELIDYDQFCNPQSSTDEVVESISPLEMEKWRDNDHDFLLIDVRESYEFEICDIGGLLIPMGEIEKNLKRIPRDKTVIIHCRSGKRSADVIRKLKSAYSYTNLINLEGGILKYAEDVDKSVTLY